MSDPLATRMSLRRAGTELVLVSFIALSQEMTLIRWVSGKIRVLAYFPNIVLISAFLGLGIGALRAGRRSLLWFWPLSLAAIVGATEVMSRIAFTNRSPTEHLWLLYLDIPNAPVVADVRPPIVIVFLLSALSFVALGQVIGERLRDFSAANTTLWGYVADLSGSLFGVIIFALASFFGTFPMTWFATFLVAGLGLFLRRGFRPAVFYLLIAATILSVIAVRERGQYYSPYYSLRTVKSSISPGVQILANGSLHQYAAPLAPADPVTNLLDLKVRTGYPLPYQVLGRKPRRVLVLGAGTGNDVEVALVQGAEHVDAVEIDPVIIQLGRTVHPDRPYASPRVRVFNVDARAYLRNTSERYDLIIFGTLDSMTRLSALSNVRLDNFVYTVECLRAARERLTEDGGVALYFMVQNQAIYEKLYAMLSEAFGAPPIVRAERYELFNTIFVAGPAWKHLQAAGGNRASPPQDSGVDLPTDDWPYLYLDRRIPSSFYVSILAVLLVLSAAAIAISSPEMIRSPGNIDVEMFLFGAAFLLLETKLVTQLSLVWGTTWVTSAVVFGSILLMILAGTVVTQIRSIPFTVAMSCLALSLMVTWIVPVEVILVRNPALRLLLSVLYSGTPILFASISFAIRFKARESSHVAFGWNLAGAVFGGLLEFITMTVGIRAMSLIALAAYLGVLILARRDGERLPA